MQSIIRVIVYGAKGAFKKFRRQSVIWGIIWGGKVQFSHILKNLGTNP